MQAALLAVRLGRAGAFAVAVLVRATMPAAGQALPVPGTPVPLGSPLPRVLPAPPPALPAPQPTPPSPATAAPNLPVRVARVRIEGVTAYPVAEIAALARGLVGPAVPLTRIDAARLAILQRYRGDGFILSAVSASLDAGGTLTFLVTEGRIASVKLAGDIGPAGTQVLRFLDHLTRQVPIDEATLERYLLLAQEVPGVTVRSVLQPSADEPGALNLVAQVSRAAVSGTVTTDNQASRITGPIETVTIANLNSLTEFGEQSSLTLYHAWPNSETFGQASEQVFLGGSGLRLQLYGGNGRTTPTGVLRQEGYLGTTTVFGGALSYPVLLARTQSLTATLRFDATQDEVSTTADGSRSRLSSDSLRLARVGLDYARSDLLFGAQHPAVSTVGVRLTQGLPALGASANGAADLPRVGQVNDFLKLDGRLTRAQTLFSPWRGASVVAVGLLTGQWSARVLPPAEEFFLGGLEFTRGYYSGEVSGDKAIAATAELQLNTTLPLPAALGLAEAAPTQFYLFYDWGEVWQNRADALHPRIASAGGGARISITPSLEGNIVGLARLNRYPTGSGAQVSPLTTGALLWWVSARF